MERKRELISNTFVLALGKFLPQLTALITLPIYTGMLLPDEYGRYDIINTVVYILDIVVLIQIPQGVFRFLVDVRNTKKANEYISSAFAFELIPSILSSVIFASVFTSLSFEIKLLLGLYNFLCIQYNVVGQIARGLGKNRIYALGAIAQSVFNMIFVVILMLEMKLGFGGLFISLNISYATGTLLQFLACKQYKFIQIKKINKSVVQEMIRYSWPMVPNTLSIWIVNASDKFIIRLFLGLEFNGVFAAAQKIPSIFTLAYSTFNLAWQESASISVRDRDYNKYCNDVFSALFDFLVGCMLLLIASSPILFKIFIHGNYELAYTQIPMLCIGIFLSCISSFLGSIYIAKKATKAVGVSSAIGALINIIANLCMVCWIGLYAASISTIISYLILVIYRANDVRKRGFVNIHYNKKRIFEGSILLVISSLFCYLNTPILNWVNLGIAIIGFLVLNKNLLKQFLNVIKQKLKGKKHE